MADRPYLGYLDKEMSIMGILSTFCIAAVALASECNKKEVAMKKKIPPPDFTLLFPPVYESAYFQYFENGQAHPFQHDATSFALVNAWWLAEASLLAYAPGDYAVQKFRAAGLQVAGGAPCERNHTQCYVAFNDRLVIVAFRGTEVLRPDCWDSRQEAWRNFTEVTHDLGTDAKFALVELEQTPGRFVHRGFLQALDDVWPLVAAHVQALREEQPTRTFWFTGHSLGAALATLAAERFAEVRGLYTYGSPRVGDEAFAGGFHVPAFRFVNHNDIVPRVPPTGPYTPPKARWGTYKHVGQFKYLTADGGLMEDPGLWERMKDRFRNEPRHVVEALRDALSGHPGGLAPDDLNDHAPLLYAIHIWNVYASSQQE